MMKAIKNLIFMIAALAIIRFLSCAPQQRINSGDAYLRIKPAAPLPEAVAKRQPVNLVVNILNVADTRTSYKNHLDLFINDRFLVLPNEEITNITSDYHYRLSLQPGIYKIKALYYASTGWQEKAYKILPRDEQVMIFADKRAILKVALRKDSWGAPVDKVTFFDINYEPINSDEE
ncbi:MAG: hypothetical protein ONB37_03610 [candidate division KSB1 bacterium]|nr:hypothetical protein [candidate division KSB1 bacterium]